MNISAPFINRPVATTLLMIALAFAGMAAFPLLPVAPLPKVDFPTINVSASLPGASPETMASAVAQPLERQFSQIAGRHADDLDQHARAPPRSRSSSSLNRDIDAAAQDVQSAIAAAGRQLPTDLPSPPTYRKVNPADSPVLVMGVHSDSLPAHRRRRLRRHHPCAADLADRRRVAGLDRRRAEAGGPRSGRSRQARRQESHARGHLRSVIAAATTNAAKGTLYSNDRSVTLAANDQLSKASDYADVIVAYRNGAAVRIKDVGEAIEGPENLYTGAWDNGKRAVLLVVFKQPGANVIETVDKVKAALPRLRAVIPPAISVDILSDRTETIRASVDDVEFTLGADHRPRRAGDPAVPAQSARDVDPGTRRAAVAARRARGHVSLRLQPRQYLADGAHHLGRLRGRRRHRRGGEHLPAYRGRHAAARGGAERLARDRLHRAVDQRLAGRRVHPATC